MDSLAGLTGEENRERRKNLLARGLCKWHYMGNNPCRQQRPCRFAHVSQDELKEVGLEPAEVMAAFPERRN